MATSDQQVQNKSIDDAEESEEFLLACDAFNFWRMRWRLHEELDQADEIEAIMNRLSELLCEHRKYNPDEFGLALEATDQRARFPFGLDPLRYAYLLAQKRPIKGLIPEIRDSVSEQILGIAVQLKKLNGSRSVLLPIEHLRTVLRCRKLVAAGAVKKLMKHELLTEIGNKAHTGHAREFRVVAKEGVDYEFINGTRTEPNPPL